MSCPRPPTSQAKPLPDIVQQLGHLLPRFCKLYSREHGIFLKTHADNDGNKPTLWIDLERSKWGMELHLAVVGGYRVEDVKESQVKRETRDDWYIPLSEVKELKKAIDKFRWFKCENCGELLLQELGEVRGFDSFRLKREVICCYGCLEKHEMGEW